MPGVEIITATRTGPQNPPGPSNATWFTLGVSERGPVGKATPVTSLGEYEQVYGGRTNASAMLYDSVQCFFEEGGSRAIVARVTGDGATPSTLTVKDGADANTLRLDASSPGSWGQGVSVQIDPAPGDPGTVVLQVFQGGQVVERHIGTTPAGLATSINTASKLLKAVPLGAATSDPQQALPATLAVTPLTGGDDMRAAITTQRVLDTADKTMPKSLGPGAISAPGWSADQIGAGLGAHAKQRGRVALISAARGADVNTAVASANQQLANGDSIGFFHPWVQTQDANGLKTIPPEGYVAGVRARAQADTGIWQNPAGTRSTARFVVGTVEPIDTSINNLLDAAKISGIVTTGSTVKLYNYRSLSPDVDQFAMLTARDFLNGLSAILQNVVDNYTFATIDGAGLLQGELIGVVTGVLQPMADAGGLYAPAETFETTDGPDTAVDDVNAGADPGFAVAVTATQAELNQNRLRILVGVRLSPTAALIQITITKANLTASVAA